VADPEDRDRVRALIDREQQPPRAVDHLTLCVDRAGDPGSIVPVPPVRYSASGRSLLSRNRYASTLFAPLVGPLLST
jgi:hypothetical protein